MSEARAASSNLSTHFAQALIPLLKETFIVLMPPNESPFSNVPYNILKEIFLQCLPEDRLDEPQPSIKITPMILCHVCATRRVVALASVSLWMHLHIRLPILWDDNDNPSIRDSAALKRDIEVMKWWRTIHSLMTPFLCINVHRISWRESETEVQETNLNSKAADFLAPE